MGAGPGWQGTYEWNGAKPCAPGTLEVTLPVDPAAAASALSMLLPEAVALWDAEVDITVPKLALAPYHATPGGPTYFCKIQGSSGNRDTLFVKFDPIWQTQPALVRMRNVHPLVLNVEPSPRG